MDDNVYCTESFFIFLHATFNILTMTDEHNETVNILVAHFVIYILYDIYM